MPQANVDFDVVIDGVGYRQMPGSVVHIARATPFTQRVAQGKPTHSDMDMWDVLSFTKFGHGLGQEGGGEAMDDMEMFYESDGVETSHDWGVQLATQVVLSDAAYVAHAYIDDPGAHVFAGGNSSIRKYTLSTGLWTDAKTGLTAAVTGFVLYQTKIYAFLGNTVNGQVCADPVGTPDTWSDLTVPRSCGCVWKDKMWAAKEGSFYPYDGSSWGSEVKAGDPKYNITALVPAANYLIVCKEDRILLYDGTNVVEAGVVIPAYSKNFANAIFWQGALWGGFLNQVNSFTGLGSAPILTERTPKLYGSEARLQYGYGAPIGFTQNCNRLFVGFDLAENSYPVVLKHNGSGWHSVYRGSPSTTLYAVYYSELADRLFLNDGATRYQRYLSNGSPYPDYPTTGTQYLDFSIDSAGFDEISKAWRSASLTVDNAGANQTVQLLYKGDKASSWTEVADDITVSPQQEVFFSNTETAIAAKFLQLRLVLTTTESNKTPRVKSATLKRLLSPPTMFIITMQVRLADNLAKIGGGQDTHTAEELMTALISASNAVAPITGDFPDGRRHRGKLSNVSFHESIKREKK